MGKEKAKIQDQRFKAVIAMRGIVVEEGLAALKGYLPSAETVEDNEEGTAVSDHLGRTWALTENVEGGICTLSAPTLAYEDMDDFLCLVGDLRERGACGGEGCGMRLFASFAGCQPRALSNLRGILAGKADLLGKALLCAAGGAREDYAPVDEEGMAEVLPTAVASDLDLEEMRACIQLGCAIAAQAANQNRAVSSAFPYENERYAFRCWLTRMGLNGPEYKACRSRLLSRLEGDSSFKGGRKRAQGDGAA